MCAVLFAKAGSLACIMQLSFAFFLSLYKVILLEENFPFLFHVKTFLHFQSFAVLIQWAFRWDYRKQFEISTR